MYTAVRLSGESLTNNVAVLWVEFGRPWVTLTALHKAPTFVYRSLFNRANIQKTMIRWKSWWNWTHMWTGRICELDACVNWTHVWTGCMCELDACVNWTHVWTGRMCELDACVNWAHMWTGRICELGAYVNWAHMWTGHWTHMWTGRICELDAYVNWTHMWTRALVAYFKITARRKNTKHLIQVPCWDSNWVHSTKINLLAPE